MIVGAFFEQHQPTKKGPVITPEHPWETGVSFLIFYSFNKLLNFSVNPSYNIVLI